MEKAQFLCIFSDKNIIRNVLLFCAVRVIYVLPKKERQVHIMRNEIRFTLEPKQRPKLAQEIGKILGTAPHYERVPSCAYDILQDTDWTKRVCCTSRREEELKRMEEFRKAQAEVEQKKEKPMSQKVFKVV